MCGALVLVVVSVSSLNVAIPEIQRSLDASGSDLQWIIDSYALVFAGLLLPAGALGDRYGRREALLAGCTLFAVASVGGMLADSATTLIVWRGVMGAAAAFIMPATLSIVATVFGPAERSKAIAIWAGFAGAGGVIGLLSSGLLLRSFWWGSVFAINLPIVLILVVAVVVVVPTSKDPDATPIDPVGAVLSIIALVGLVFGIIEGAEKGWGAAPTLAAFGTTLIGFAAFVAWELRTKHPMLDPRFFLDRRFSLGSLSITAAFFGIFGMFFVLTQFLQFVQEYDALGAAVRIVPYGVVLLVVSPRAAVLAERWGSSTVTVLGLLIAAAGFVMLGLLNASSPYPPIAVGLITVALGTGLLMPPATTNLVASLPASKAGVGSAVNDTTREVGGAIGIAVVGALMSIGYRDTIEPATDGLDAEVAEAATDSFGALLTVAGELDASSRGPLIEVGREAFVDGMRIGMFAAAGLLAATATLVAAFRPEHSHLDTTTSSKGTNK